MFRRRSSSETRRVEPDPRVDGQAVRLPVASLEVVVPRLIELEAGGVVDPQIDGVVGAGPVVPGGRQLDLEVVDRLEEPHADVDCPQECERIVGTPELEAVVAVEERGEVRLAADAREDVEVGVIRTDVARPRLFKWVSGRDGRADRHTRTVARSSRSNSPSMLFVFLYPQPPACESKCDELAASMTRGDQCSTSPSHHLVPSSPQANRA